MGNFLSFAATDAPDTSTGVLMASRQSHGRARGLWSAVAATLALATLQAGTVANADTPAASKAVSLADLDLRSSQDLATARARLRGAATEVCRSGASGLDPLADAYCASDTYATAIKKVNAHLAATTSTSARTAADPASIPVSLSGLDLANSEHREIVRSRLKAAAKEVCKTTTGVVDPWADARCEKDTYTSALKKLNEQLITAGLAAGVQPLARVDSN